ncbi:response regulator [Parafilimonas terrae]|jgi:CheY-like chemotaxis protein|uniref:Response regulator receiver domain-containing protein n=1 Tax=Parafilimonas terrae TaxID=1465490 RepID=A0A1I5S3C2_9BACT|nr:response regulator [Parafilimonas terrae]SFP65081.1 Response regulator receiver domain-containing protein [Parafilimonas terrae]
MVQAPTLLLIDDDADDQEIFSIALQNISTLIRFVISDNCKEALEKLTKDKMFKPDFIFLDLNMPGMSGSQCLAEIKKQKRLKHIPVIIYTTSSGQRDKEETKKLGANYFLTKPTDINKLITILKKILSGEEKFVEAQ